MRRIKSQEKMQTSLTYIGLVGQMKRKLRNGGSSLVMEFAGIEKEDYTRMLLHKPKPLNACTSVQIEGSADGGEKEMCSTIIVRYSFEITHEKGIASKKYELEGPWNCVRCVETASNVRHLRQTEGQTM